MQPSSWEIHIFLFLTNPLTEKSIVTIVAMCGKVRFLSYLLKRKYVGRELWVTFLGAPLKF